MGGWISTTYTDIKSIKHDKKTVKSTETLINDIQSHQNWIDDCKKNKYTGVIENKKISQPIPIPCPKPSNSLKRTKITDIPVKLVFKTQLVSKKVRSNDVGAVKPVIIVADSDRFVFIFVFVH